MNTRSGFIFALLSCVLSQAFSTRVTSEGTTTVGFHQDASFSCALSKSDGVSQVTWQRLVNNRVENLVTFSKLYGVKILHHYGARINFTEAALNSTSIKILNVTLEDEACYICSFHVYPSGSLRKQTCLSVRGIFDVKAGIKTYRSGENSQEDKVVVNCSCTGKPAPKISWNASDEFTDSPLPSSVSNEDGTVTVTSELTLPLSKFKHVNCLLSSAGTAHTIIKRIDFPDFPNLEEVVPPRFPPQVIVVIILLVAVAVLCIAYTIKRKKEACEDFLHNGREWMAQRCSFFAVSIEEEN